MKQLIIVSRTLFINQTYIPVAISYRVYSSILRIFLGI
nr:MAG TPA: hypothetical protein [Caudoviricetes sp.]